MKSKRQQNFENRIMKPAAAATVAVLGFLGVMHERDANIKHNQIPGISQIANEPHRNYIVHEGDTPIGIAEKYGQSSDSKLVGEIGEQEQDGFLVDGQSVMIPEKEIRHQPPTSAGE